MTREEWFVGVDWATEEHCGCLLDAHGKVLGERAFAHSGAGIAEMCSWLFDMTGTDDASTLLIAIETTRGAVVETLLERGMLVHSINPKQLDRFRDRFTVAGAKDDRRDARVLADSLRTDRACFRLLRVDDPLVIELREWERINTNLQQDRVALANRMRDLLLRFYPQILELAGHDIAHDSFLGFWELVPSPADAAKVREKKIAKYLIEAPIRRFDAAHAMTTLRQKPLTVAEGTTKAAIDHIATIVEQLRLINRLLKNAKRRLDQIIEAIAKASAPEEKREQCDVNILRSLPGIGRIVLATLLTEAFQPLANRDYHGLRLLTGVAPVTKSSGKSKSRPKVVMRQACSPRLRNAIYHWANIALQHDPKSRVVYVALRSRGKTHGRAVRGVADRLLKVACTMLREGTIYDPSRRVVV